MVKSLIGSIVGAAVALGIYYGIKQSTGETYVWFPLIIGLIVGIATRVASGSSLTAGSRVVAGALAAIIAGCAMFGPDVVEGMTGSAEFGPIETTKDRLVNSTIEKSDDDSESADEESGDDSTSEDGDADEAADQGKEDGEGSDSDQDSATGDESADESGSDEGGDETGSDDAEGSEAKDEAPTNVDVNQAFAERGILKLRFRKTRKRSRSLRN